MTLSEYGFNIVFGILAIAILGILGFHIPMLVKDGPGPLRKFLLAALAFLGTFGFNQTSVLDAQEVVADSTSESPLANIEQDPAGKQLLEIWQEAEEVGSGKRGAYPFDRAGQQKLLSDLKKAEILVNTLVKKKIFLLAEGELLKLDLLELSTAVQEKRPKELESATCYKPMMFTPTQDSFKRLEARILFLEKLAKDRISPLVAKKILDRVKEDLKTLGKRNQNASYDKVDEEHAKGLEERVEKILCTPNLD